MPRFLIDIGHGFYDTRPESRFDLGAVAPNGTTEFSLNVLTGTALLTRLQMLGQFAAFVPYGLERFARGIYASGYDCLVSVHHNASKAHFGQGAEACILEKSPHVDRSTQLALTITKSIAQGLQIPNRGPRPANLEILRAAAKTNVKAAVLTEGFFIDAGLDEAKMRDLARREGYLIADALHQFFGD